MKPYLAVASSDSEKLWAEHGITGLVLFALFGLVLFLVSRFSRMLAKQSESHQNHMAKMIEDEREERKVTREVNAHSSDKLATAIDALTEQFREDSKARLAAAEQINLTKAEPLP